MSKRTRKLVSILLTLSLLVALLVPMATPAGAVTVNRIDRVVKVASDYISTAGTGSPLTVLTIREDGKSARGTIKPGDTFSITLKSGVEWTTTTLTGSPPVVVYSGAQGSAGTIGESRSTITNGASTPAIVDLIVDRVSPTTLEVTVPPTSSSTPYVVDINEDAVIQIPLWVDINGVEGDIFLNVTSRDSGVSNSSNLIFATVQSGTTNAIAESVEKIGRTGTGGVIRIDETSITALGSTGSMQTFRLRLPANFSWGNLQGSHDASGAVINPETDITFGGSLAGSRAEVLSGATGQTAEIRITVLRGGTGGPGSIYIQTPITANTRAAYGDIEVSLLGNDKINDATLIVAEYVNWGVDISVKSVKELIAGKVDLNVTTDEITIKENIAGTLIRGRLLNVKLPDWVKVTNYSQSSSSGFTVKSIVSEPGEAIDGTSNDFDIEIMAASSTAGKVVFKLDLSIEGNMSGDIEAIVSGAGVEEQTVVIATAMAPVSASIEKLNDVKIGVQSQDIDTIVITEEIKGGAVAKPAGGLAGNIVITAPTGVKFASTPVATVTDGNLTLKSGQKLADSDTQFLIPVDADSTRPSTIEITNVKVTVDRTYPEGDIQFKIGGAALVENANPLKWVGKKYNPAGADDDAGNFTTANVMKLKVANCVTPAPGEVLTTETIFTIGSTTYLFNGVEQTMDIAPYIKDSRTFLPLRFVARATGVLDENILFNQEYQTVTMIKGDRVVVVTIGSNILQVNGAPITMDTAPELIDPPGRTMFPIRWIATALGCNVDWDEDTQEVTIH